jgi:hypothetical protein
VPESENAASFGCNWTNAAPAAAGDNPSRLQAEIRQNPSGRIKRAGRVSECLEESPHWLARPSPRKSWDVSRRAGVSSRRGVTGATADIPVRRRTLSSLSRGAVPRRNPFNPSKPVSRQGSGYAPAPTCDILVLRTLSFTRNPSVGEPVGGA